MQRPSRAAQKSMPLIEQKAEPLDNIAEDHASRMQVLLAEYSALRTELNTDAQIISNVFLVTITAAGALIGVGVNLHNWVIFLAPLVILFPSLWFIAAQLESVAIGATYLSAVLEPELKYARWERLLFAMRQQQKAPKRHYILSITGIYSALMLLSLVLAYSFLFVYQKPSWGLVVLLIVGTLVILGVLLTTLFVTKDRFSSEHFEAYQERWKAVKEQFDQRAQTIKSDVD